MANSNHSAALIEKWFRRHDGDGEFVSPARCSAYTVIGSEGEPGNVLFTTKPALMVKVLDRYPIPGTFALLGRVGLPAATDVGWMRNFIGKQKLMFLGDMDPVDLLIFAWLREHLGSTKVVYLGVSDRVIDVAGVKLSPANTIPLSKSEQKALPLLSQALPGFETAIGPNCAAALTQGRKMELEAVVCFPKNKRGLHHLLVVPT